MASDQDNNKRDADQSRTIRQREALNNAFAALLGQQNIQTFTAFTFEDAMDAQIERIEGKGTKLRPNQLDRVTRVEQELTQALTQLKETPVSDFVEPDADDDVNTEENPEEP